MAKLLTKAKCNSCAGCYKFRDSEFRGILQCDEFSKAQQKVWCADETIKEFIRKRAYSR